LTRKRHSPPTSPLSLFFSIATPGHCHPNPRLAVSQVRPSPPPSPFTRTSLRRKERRRSCCRGGASPGRPCTASTHHHPPELRRRQPRPAGKPRLPPRLFTSARCVPAWLHGEDEGVAARSASHGLHGPCSQVAMQRPSPPGPILFFVFFSSLSLSTWKFLLGRPTFQTRTAQEFSRPFNSSKNFEISVKYDKNQRTSNANNFRSTNPN
jgi:hypothetical protein